MHRSSWTLPQQPLKGATRLRLAVLTLLVSFSPATAFAQNASRGPDVTIVAAEEKTIFEYRQGGQLRMVKVIPVWGKPYYLVPGDPSKGYGDLENADMLLPSWVIIEF